MAGIYLHTPFCNKKCIYCGFYSVVSKRLRDKYIPALEREILERRNFFDGLYPSERIIRTLYIGGGTPSVLPVDFLEKAAKLLKENFRFAEGAFETQNPDVFEFTVEVNPDDITEDYAQSLRKLGINRISMGVQSFQDSHLQWMGRRHDASQAIKAFRILRDEGFTNISLDLIFGFPLMTERDWEDNLRTVAELAPEHISAYQLGIDQDTPLERLAASGKFSLLPEEVCAAQYKTLQKRLSDAGYIQYEVSNFCLPSLSGQVTADFRSRHNSSYWKRIPYLGLGPGAHSFIGRHREWNFPDVDSYCNLSTFEIREGENLSSQDVFNEILMLALRTADGVSLKSLRECDPRSAIFISQMLPALQGFQRQGLIQMTAAGTIKIPSEKFFISDGIIRDLFV